jgi:hypothetical protein
MARGDGWLAVRSYLASHSRGTKIGRIPRAQKKIDIIPKKKHKWETASHVPRQPLPTTHCASPILLPTILLRPPPNHLPHSPWRRGQSLGHGKLRPCDLLTGSNQSKEALGEPISRSAPATAWPNRDPSRVHPAASLLPPWGDAAKGSDGDQHLVNLVGAGSCRSGVGEEGLKVRITGVLRQRQVLSCPFPGRCRKRAKQPVVLCSAHSPWSQQGHAAPQALLFLEPCMLTSWLIHVMVARCPPLALHLCSRCQYCSSQGHWTMQSSFTSDRWGSSLAY